MDNLAVANPLEHTNGNLYLGYFTEIEYWKYQTVELISVPNIYHNYQNPEYYVWMIVDAQE